MAITECGMQQLQQQLQQKMNSEQQMELNESRLKDYTKDNNQRSVMAILESSVSRVSTEGKDDWSIHDAGDSSSSPRRTSFCTQPSVSNTYTSFNNLDLFCDSSLLYDVDLSSDSDHVLFNDDYRSLGRVDELSNNDYRSLGRVDQLSNNDYRSLGRVDQLSNNDYRSLGRVDQLSNDDYRSLGRADQLSNNDYISHDKVDQSSRDNNDNDDRTNFSNGDAIDFLLSRGDERDDLETIDSESPGQDGHVTINIFDELDLDEMLSDAEAGLLDKPIDNIANRFTSSLSIERENNTSNWGPIYQNREHFIGMHLR